MVEIFMTSVFKSVITFREIGKGLEVISSFCHSMNMPLPLANIRINDVLHQVYFEVASVSMLDSANKTLKSLIKEGQDVTADEDVSLDGTWQNRAILLKIVL